MAAKLPPGVVPAREPQREPQAEPVAGLLRVTVQIGDRRFDEDLATQAMITPNIEALNEALATNPARFGEWAMLEALAREEHDKILGNIAALDSDIKDAEAEIYLEVVEAPLPPVAKPPTVDAVKARVTIDPRRREMAERRRGLEVASLAAKASLEKIAVGRKTIEQKRESLLALASNWRQEMQQRLTVNAQQFRPGRPG